MTSTFVPTAEEAAGPLDGAGPASSGYDLGSAILDQDAFGIAAAAAGAGLDALKFVGDPVGEGLRSAAGWLIEHISFLREPLDWLAGDPARIVAGAEDWHRGAQALAAEARARANPQVGSWTGTAVDAAAGAAHREAEALAQLAASCDALAQQVVRTAGLIGVERSLIRDAVAEFVARIVEWAIGAILSAGLLLAVAVAPTVIEAVSLGRRIVQRIDELMEHLARSVSWIGRMRADIENTRAVWSHLDDAGKRRISLGTSLRSADEVGEAFERVGVAGARRITEPFGGDHANDLHGLAVDATVEVGKETGKAAATLDGWTDGRN
ncbi:hypothetical protein [Pseudonocardia ailaonensis]